MSESGQQMPSRVWGLFNRRERWGLSMRGWGAVGMIVLLLGSAVLAGIFPFLAISSPVPSEVLVVEGWVPMFTIRAAAQEIEAHGYRQVFTTGGPIGGTGPYSSEYTTSAHVAYTRLISVGVSTNLLHKVPSKIRDRDRTYSAALALRSWFTENGTAQPRSLNVITESTHARRSRLLFQKALGPETTVGIISVPPVDYPANHWWKYSEGVKEVISEGASYIYARFFFWP